MNKVTQIMSRNVITIDPDASCYDAITVMTRDRIRHLPVVGPDGVLRGIVTDRDLRHHLFEPEVLRTIGTVPVARLLSGVPVRQVMSTPVISIGPDQHLDEAAEIMRKHKLGSLPVVDHERITGIVTETDVLRQIVDISAGSEIEAIVVSYP
ncbi:MAG TPA: CBS domain-containing protein [Methylomirabilota bacterium]|nr:CBS domain-containing protein [Methylomirabilota bacterium]